MQAFMIYVAGFYGNLGNYKSFGDTKIIPDVSVESLEKLLKASVAYKQDPGTMDALWAKIAPRISSLTPRQTQLGLGDKVSACVHWSILNHVLFLFCNMIHCILFYRA